MRHQILQRQVVCALPQRVLLVRLQAQRCVRPMPLFAASVVEHLTRNRVQVVNVLRGGRRPG